MAADKTDQPGVLGNLPRSRPGQRSEKRSGASRPAAPAAAKPGPRAGSGAKRKTATARKPSAPRKAATARKPAAAAPRRERPAPQSAAAVPDPLGFALRTAGKVAEAGLKTAGGILRRIPGR